MAMHAVLAYSTFDVSTSFYVCHFSTSSSLSWLTLMHYMPCGWYIAKFTPWQIILTTLSTVYAVRNVDTLLGLGCQYHYFIKSTIRF